MLPSSGNRGGACSTSNRGVSSSDMAFFGPAMRRMLQNNVPFCSRRGARVLVRARRNTMLRELEESRNETQNEQLDREVAIGACL